MSPVRSFFQTMHQFCTKVVNHGQVLTKVSVKGAGKPMQ